MTMVSNAQTVLNKVRQQQQHAGQVPAAIGLPRAGSAGAPGPPQPVGPQSGAVVNPGMLPNPNQMDALGLGAAFHGGASSSAFSTPFPGVPLPSSSSAKTFTSGAPGSPSKGPFLNSQAAPQPYSNMGSLTAHMQSEQDV
jgi:hypothetical protein